jgi:NADP-dependent 3-hydroxy acid dehydrogenase YdfG
MRAVSTLERRVSIVTGASSGVGAAIARALAAEGAIVVLAARTRDMLSVVCDRIRRDGGTAEPVVTDMRREEDVERLVETAVRRFGHVDALINNAATGTVRLITEGRTEEWRTILETNVIGTLVACRAVLRHMLPRRQGDILNVTSASAYEPWPYLSVYGASKAAVHSLSQTLRREVSSQGVRVMTLEIHHVGGTNFASTFDPDLTVEAIQRWTELGLLNPSVAMLEPEDVARAVVFQLSQPDPGSLHHIELRPRTS